MIKSIAVAAGAALLGLAVTACSNGPLATQSSSAGSSSVPVSQMCGGLSGTERQDCINGDHSQHMGNRATGGAGGSSTGAPGMAGTSGGASGGMR